MKPLIGFLIAVCLTNCSLHAQELVQKKYIVYNTRIQDVSGHSYAGFIATINDTSVFMSERKFALTFENLDLTHLQKFGYADISKISLRAGSIVRRGALIGAISGLVVGALIGYASVDPKPAKNSFEIFPQPTPLQASIIGGAIGAALGSVVGILCSHPHQAFKIHGKKANLDDMREAMIRRLY